MKQYPIYEVQKFGVTLEFDKDFRVADAAYKTATPGGVRLFKLDTSTGNKTVISSK